MLQDEDDDNAGGTNPNGAKHKSRRAGELYDAFAGESDEDLLSTDDER